MPLPVLPDWFPGWDVPDFSVEPAAGGVTTDFEQGASRNRRRFLNVPHVHAATCLLTWQQLAQWEYWWDNVIDGGHAWHVQQLPFAGVVQAVECQFKPARYSYQRERGQWVRLAARWQVRDAPKLSAAAYNALL